MLIGSRNDIIFRRNDTFPFSNKLKKVDFLFNQTTKQTIHYSPKTKKSNNNNKYFLC